MRALALIVLAPLFTLADPIATRAERIPRQDTASFSPNGLPRSSSMVSGTTSTPTSTPTISFTITINSELTTCQSSTITWVSGGPVGLISFSISNAGVKQGSPLTNSNPGQGSSNTRADGMMVTRPADPASVDGTVVYTLVENVAADAGSYTWDKVNVTQGWYIFIAQETSTGGVLGRTVLSFFIRNGTDVSCLHGQSTASSQPSITSSQTSKSESTGSGIINTDIDGQKKHTNIGGIVGGVVGGVVVLLVLVYGYLMRRSKKRSSARDAGTMVYAQHTRTQMLPAGTHAAKIREQQRRQVSPHPPTDNVQQGEDEEMQMPPAEKERQREAFPHPPSLLIDTCEPPGQPREPEPPGQPREPEPPGQPREPEPPGQPREPEPPERDEQRPSASTSGPDPADGDDIAVLRAQLSSVMIRVAMLEANERVQAEDPPDYVSSYEPS